MQEARCRKCGVRRVVGIAHDGDCYRDSKYWRFAYVYTDHGGRLWAVYQSKANAETFSRSRLDTSLLGLLPDPTRYMEAVGMAHSGSLRVSQNTELPRWVDVQALRRAGTLSLYLVACDVRWAALQAASRFFADLVDTHEGDTWEAFNGHSPLERAVWGGFKGEELPRRMTGHASLMDMPDQQWGEPVVPVHYAYKPCPM